MKMKKKFLLALALMLVFSSVAPAVFAEDEIVPPIRQQSGGGLLAELQNQKLKAEAEAKAKAAQQPVKVLFTMTLKKGSMGVEVIELQKVLGITADGKFGPKTQTALVQFQVSKGLVGDGIAGPKTRAVLNQ